ncbi:MAG: UbiA family prenyltransferase [Chitinispirillaceae bacterium]|nr:UbiA family prenyltransferase [Chitinispirillaceae bacterium]
MKIKLLRILDCFFLTRPVVLVPVWGFCLFGYYRAHDTGISGLPALWHAAGPEVLLWIMAFSLSVGCVFVLNQIADVDIDKKNSGLPLLAAGVVTRRSAYATAALAGLASLAIPLCAGRPAIALFSIAGIAVGALYSFRPSYLSGRPFTDFLANAAGAAAIAFGMGWHLAGRTLADPAFVPAAAPYFLLMCAGSISSTIPDISGDRVGKKRTTAVSLGPKKAHYLATVFIMAAAVCSLTVRDPIALACAVASLPLYLLHLLFPKEFFAEATYKAGGAFCMAAAACIMPLFLLCGSAVAAMTWMYFRLRHGVRYPSLVPDRKISGIPAGCKKPKT